MVTTVNCLDPLSREKLGRNSRHTVGSGCKKLVTRPLPERYRHLRTFAFGDNRVLADQLLELVIKGIKTATCSTDDEPNTSVPGERWIVLDGHSEPRCVIESTEVRYQKFKEIDAAFVVAKTLP